jgi:hypothetical protein
MRVLLVALMFACLALTFGQAASYVGTYDVVRFDKGKPIDNNSLPPGQVMILELKKNGSFQMHNFLSGFDGSWKLAGKQLMLTFITGPAGKVKKPDVVTVQPMPDRTKLVIVGPKSFAGQLEFHWNPKATENWNRRMSEAMKKAQPLKKPGG